MILSESDLCCFLYSMSLMSKISQLWTSLFYFGECLYFLFYIGVVQFIWKLLSDSQICKGATETAVHFNTYKGTHLRFVYQDITYRVEKIFLISEFCDIHHVLNFRNIWLLCMAGFRTQLLNTGKLEERNT